MLADETRKVRLGIAVADNQDFVGGLQLGSDSRKIGFGVMGMTGPDRTGFVMDMTLPGLA